MLGELIRKLTGEVLTRKKQNLHHIVDHTY